MGETRPRSPASRRPVLTTPARAGILLGASAAVYGVSLAAVSGFQAQADAAVDAARRPALDDVSAARAAGDALEDRLRSAEVALHDLASDYGRVGADVGDLSARLDRLAALVAEVEGSAAALPARIALPTVSVRSIPVGASGSGGSTSRPPRTSGRSGASGG